MPGADPALSGVYMSGIGGAADGRQDVAHATNDGWRRPSWIILRTAAPRTLRLADSLAQAGFGVWTPRQTISRRIPRSKDKQRREVETPIIPTVVFADAEHKDVLRALAAQPLHPHPPFSLMTYRGGVPEIKDGEVHGLRIEERRMQTAADDRARRTRRNARGKAVAIGATIGVPTPAFQGISGIVEESDGRFTLALVGNMRLKIATFLLDDDRLKEPSSQTGTAA